MIGRVWVVVLGLLLVAAPELSAHGVSAADRAFMGVSPLVRCAAEYQGRRPDFRSRPRLGLASKLQDFALPRQGLVAKIVSFNVGVEMGQFLALGAILIGMAYWRRTAAFERQAFASNVVLMTCGFVLFGDQTSGYFLE